MTGKYLQNLINQTRDIIDDEFGILDENGFIIACSDEKRIGQADLLIHKVMESKEQLVVLEGSTYQKIYEKNKVQFVAFIRSDTCESQKCLSLVSISIINIKVYYDEKYDRESFIKNVMLGSVLPGDISLRAKELHLPYAAFRVVFLIKTQTSKDIYTNEVIQGLFPNRTKDFIVVLDEENTILVKELRTGEDYREIDKAARIIIDTLNTESMVKAFIGIGTVVDNLAEIGNSFTEAQIALQVGSIFESDKSVFNYNKLGIGRLIYQLPANLCRLFLQEVFNVGSYEALDAETIHTIQKFFENNLNVSETSRQLYVHRNTLVYRLDKIQKETGLDIRKFDDAIIFKVAMMVKKYLEKVEKDTPINA